MPPRPSKGDKAKSKGQESQREESLQAIVLADSFETRFTPFTFERPRCLLPLANTPLIEYTLEFLASAGVRDVFICCGLHTEQVEEYINSSKWKLPSSPFRHLLLLKSPAASIGDAMRDLDGRDLITGDFLLVSGDLVSNIALEPILSRHRVRREKDKNAIMTIVLREAGLNHRIRNRGRKPVFVIDSKNERCLQYEETGSRTDTSRRINIDPSGLKGPNKIEIRGDLIDCYIDICTPEVLGLWSDNFDYTNLRRSFLHGVLKDYELNGKTIYAEITKEQYAARVKNLRAYNNVSSDILGRWTYPICPDSNLVPGQSYRFGKGNIYKERDVELARTCTVKRKVIVGYRTKIEDRSLVVDSTIGRNCQIGSDVHISGSYIWNGVKIGDGTKITRAIIASGANIGKNCKIDPGALVSFGACLADGTNVSRARHVNRTGRREEDDGKRNQLSPVGEGFGASLQAPLPDDDSDASSLLDSPPDGRNTHSPLSDDSISEFSESLPNISRRSSLRSDPSNDSAPNRDFLVEATANIFEGLQNGVSSENISLELVSLRMTENASQHQVRHAVVMAFMKRTLHIINENGLSTQEAVREVFTKNKEIVRRTMFDESTETKGDQVDFLLLLQKDVAGKPNGGSLFTIIATELYNLDLVEEDGIMQWWEDDRSKHGGIEKVRTSAQQLITFLQEAEEESD